MSFSEFSYLFWIKNTAFNRVENHWYGVSFFYCLNHLLYTSRFKWVGLFIEDDFWGNFLPGTTLVIGQEGHARRRILLLRIGNSMIFRDLVQVMSQVSAKERLMLPHPGSAAFPLPLHFVTLDKLVAHPDELSLLLEQYRYLNTTIPLCSSCSEFFSSSCLAAGCMIALACSWGLHHCEHACIYLYGCRRSGAVSNCQYGVVVLVPYSYSYCSPAPADFGVPYSIG